MQIICIHLKLFYLFLPNINMIIYYLPFIQIYSWELIFIYCGLFVLILVVLCCFFFHYIVAKFPSGLLQVIYCDLG